MHLSLRAKLLAASLSLLALPWVGYRYVNEMERFLRQAQEQALLARAQAAAAVLASRPEPFARHSERIAGAADEDIYFVRSLGTPVQLDGYADEWRPWLDLARLFQTDSGFRVEHLLAAGGEELYVLFRISDDRTIYRDPRLRLEGDHLEVAVEDSGEIRHYRMSTAAPGRLNAYRVQPDGVAGPWEPALRGEWQESAEGYTIELRVPRGFGNRIGFTLRDVDTPGSVAGEVNTGPPGGTGVLLYPQPVIEALIAGLASSHTRAWVVDTAARVLAVSGRLQPEEAEAGMGGGLADLLFGLFVPVPAYDFSDALARASRLDGAEVTAALSGRTGARRRSSGDGRAVIASAAYPIEIEGRPVGAVVVEETTNAILSVQNQAMQRLVTSTLVALGLAVSVLLLFASRLSSRVRRLRDEAEAAIGPDGRVHGGVTGSRAGDEIGDLSRSFAGLLQRLGQYNRYLEGMAGKLAHELRTPVVVVKSSLENLEQAQGPDRATYLQRARDGIERLGTLLQRLSEATRLEHALADAELERFDLRGLVEAVAGGYRTAYPDTAIVVDLPAEPLPVCAAPDLVAQMLDKLVANAVDFAREGSAVEIRLTADDGGACLAVSNEGPALPEQMRERLFESMVSVREKKGDAPHLGLGLYIVRLVAEFHQGRVEAHNRPAGDGVTFTVTLPLSQGP